MYPQSEFLEVINSASISCRFPDEVPYSGISVASVAEISERFGTNGKDVEIAALENGIVPLRYVRNMRSFSFSDQIRLLQSVITIVGLGGLGGMVTEILARAGIGTLHLIDADDFEDTNLNRQFLSSPSVLSSSKADAAEQRVRTINPSITVYPHKAFFDGTTATSFIRNSDAVLDCLDNLKTRLMLESWCKQHNIPLVSAAIAGASGQITVVFPDDIGLKLIYGDSENLNAKGAERSLGCLPYAASLIASLECSELIKILLKNGKILRNQLMIVDLMDNTIETLNLIPLGS